MSSTQAKKEVAVIIGAGPAGLTAAYELLQSSDIHPIVLEMSDAMGGISRTVEFNENRMDLGGHRFFSKSEKVIDWWLDILPLQDTGEDFIDIKYQQKTTRIASQKQNLEEREHVMLVRQRISRIFFDGKFFEYPLSLSWNTIRDLGLWRMIKIAYTYALRLILPRKENNLEDFFINRFGTELYLTFFKTYTEKVWGMACTDIGADWGKQRIKGLSVRKALMHSFTRLFPFFRKKDISQKHVETSLIEYFLYPKYGPGHLWEKVAQLVQEKGGEVRTHAKVTRVSVDSGRVVSVTYIDTRTSEEITLACDYVFSSMPISDLFASFDHEVPLPVHDIATALQFREFITVGLLLKSDALKEMKDTWIYIHDPKVKVGRIQFFHNWSPHLVPHKDTTLVGLEFFCTEGDAFWQQSDAELMQLALDELRHIGFTFDAVLDMHVERVYKAYPVYTGAYTSFAEVKEYINTIENLYPIGRNGMHRYNNQDHSMLTAMASVEAIHGRYEKSAIWDINAEDEYHEEK